MTNVPTIFVQKFWTEYKPDPADASKLIPVDKVAYGPIGSLDKSITVDRVSRLLNYLQPMHDQSNPAIVMAHMRADIIRKHYEAWKSGQEAPADGTPISAWNAITPEQAEAFRARGIRTIEDVSALTDAHFERFQIPQIRNLVKQAALFLESKEATRAAAALAERDKVIKEQGDALSAQQAQIAALLERIDQLAEIVVNTPNGDSDDAGQSSAPVKRRGRPPKQPMAAVA